MSWAVGFWVTCVVMVLYALHRGALAMERRGWIYYRERKASSSSASNAFLEVQALFEPRAEHLVESRRSDEIRTAEDAGPGGAPPKAG